MSQFIAIFACFVCFTTLATSVPQFDTLFNSTGSNVKYLSSCSVVDDTLMYVYIDTQSQTSQGIVYHSTDGSMTWDSILVDSIRFEFPQPLRYSAVYGISRTQSSAVVIDSYKQKHTVDFRQQGIPEALVVSKFYLDPNIKGRIYVIARVSPSSWDVEYLYTADSFDGFFREIPIPRHSVGINRKATLSFDYSDSSKLYVQIDGKDPLTGNHPLEVHTSRNRGDTWDLMNTDLGGLTGLHGPSTTVLWASSQKVATNPILYDMQTQQSDTLHWHEQITTLLLPYVDTSTYKIRFNSHGRPEAPWRYLYFTHANKPDIIVSFATAMHKYDTQQPTPYFLVRSTNGGINWSLVAPGLFRTEATRRYGIEGLSASTRSGDLFITVYESVPDTDGKWIRDRSYVLTDHSTTGIVDRIAPEYGVAPFPNPANQYVCLTNLNVNSITDVYATSTAGESCALPYSVLDGLVVVNTSSLTPGAYIIRLDSSGRWLSVIVFVSH